MIHRLNVLCVLALAVAVAAAVPSHAQTMLATGSDPSADGYLDVGLDEYGSWGAIGGSAYEDRFNPVGSPGQFGLQSVSLTNGFFLFGGSGSSRELLSDIASWQGIFGLDNTLQREVTSTTIASDSNFDGVNDTGASSFRVFNSSGFDVSFDLTSVVSVFEAGQSATIRQTYTMTNNSSTPASFRMVRAADFNLLWAGNNSADDEVGTGANGAGFGPYAFQREVDDTTGDPIDVTAITLSGGPLATVYYGGKHGIEPDGGPPAFGFGTDVQVWEAFGVPASWENFMAGVGYDTNGSSGEFPAGSTPPEDAFIGLGFEINLDAERLAELRVAQIYGRPSPDIPEPSTFALSSLMIAGLLIRAAKHGSQTS